MRDFSSKYFNCTDRERAIFEAGIKLGAIFHQYTGIPVSSENVEAIQKAIESAVQIQPFVEHISVSIDVTKMEGTAFHYSTLSGEMIDAILTINYNGSRVHARMKYIEELNYPLMYLEE
ncbi:MAG: dihydroneopterin aldolase family protein [Ferroplasma sp.]